MRNAQITGKPKALTVETEQTETALAEGPSVLQNVAISGELDSKEGIYTNAMFEADGNRTNQTLDLGSRDKIEAANMWMSGWTR